MVVSTVGEATQQVQYYAITVPPRFRQTFAISSLTPQDYC